MTSSLLSGYAFASLCLASCSLKETGPTSEQLRANEGPRTYCQSNVSTTQDSCKHECKYATNMNNTENQATSSGDPASHKQLPQLLSSRRTTVRRNLDTKTAMPANGKAMPRETLNKEVMFDIQLLSSFLWPSFCPPRSAWGHSCRKQIPWMQAGSLGGNECVLLDI